jgi:hypothetical protein
MRRRPTSQLVLTGLSLPEELTFQLKLEARGRGMSFAAVVRECIDRALGRGDWT